MVDERDKTLALWTQRLLRSGVAGSALLMIAGLACNAKGVDGDPLIRAGLCVLIATPAGRVVLSATSFALARDWAFFWVTAAVLGLMLAGAIG